MFLYLKKQEIPILPLILNTHLWYECDYSVITPKITEINPNYFSGFLFENLKL